MAFTGEIDASSWAALDLAEAFRGRSSDGDAVLRMMKDLVYRRQDWLG